VRAWQVRDIFRLAKEKAPAIIFIDEIDAVGTKRFDSTGGADREVQRILLELLTQVTADGVWRGEGGGGDCMAARAVPAHEAAVGATTAASWHHTRATHPLSRGTTHAPRTHCLVAPHTRHAPTVSWHHTRATHPLPRGTTHAPRTH
jgi:hypothetical protein